MKANTWIPLSVVPCHTRHRGQRMPRRVVISFVDSRVIFISGGSLPLKGFIEEDLIEDFEKLLGATDSSVALSLPTQLEDPPASQRCLDPSHGRAAVHCAPPRNRSASGQLSKCEMPRPGRGMGGRAPRRSSCAESTCALGRRPPSTSHEMGCDFTRPYETR